LTEQCAPFSGRYPDHAGGDEIPTSMEVAVIALRDGVNRGTETSLAYINKNDRTNDFGD
jgi:hypothetical protein